MICFNKKNSSMFVRTIQLSTLHTMTLLIHDICPYIKTTVAGVFEKNDDRSCLEQNVSGNHGVEEQSKTVFVFFCSTWFVLSLFYDEIK